MGHTAENGFLFIGDPIIMKVSIYERNRLKGGIRQWEDYAFSLQCNHIN